MLLPPQEKSVVEVVEKPKEKEKATPKNTNLTDPRKLSDILMSVLGTGQRYLTVNGFRQLFALYLRRNQNIKVDTCRFDYCLNNCLYRSRMVSCIQIANLPS